MTLVLNYANMVEHMNKSRSEKLKKHWATLSKEKRSERTRKGGLALWKKIKSGSLTMKA